MRLVLAVGMMAVGVAAGRAADPAYPRLKGKAGDTAAYKKVEQVGANKSEQVLRMTLVKTDGKTADVSVQVLIKGVDLPAIQILGVPAGVDLDPAELASQVFNKLDYKPTVLETGKETVTVAGKKYDCTWAKVRRTVGAAGSEVVTDCKFWHCPDAPLAGLVKVETASTLPGVGEIKNSLELTDPPAK